MISLNLDDVLLHMIYIVGAINGWSGLSCTADFGEIADRRYTLSFERFNWKGAVCRVMISNYRLSFGKSVLFFLDFLISPDLCTIVQDDRN